MFRWLMKIIEKMDAKSHPESLKIGAARAQGPDGYDFG